MRRSSGASMEKTLEKGKKHVQDGNYYEGQQLYKSVYYRFISAKKYTEAIDLLQSGACIQLKHGQVTCGVELAVLLVETMSKAKTPVDNIALDRIRSIFNEFPRNQALWWQSGEDQDLERETEGYVTAKTRVEGCYTFLKAAIKWSIESGGPKRGQPELHDMLAEYIWTQSPDMDFGKASLHFVRGSGPQLFAICLSDYIAKCSPSEADLVIARGVLLYLSLGNLRDANGLVNEVKVNLTKKSQVFPNTPLMQFIKYLLLTLERDALPLFKMLRESYKPHIQQDPFFDECLNEIAGHFYGMQRKNGLQGMLGDIFKMLSTEDMT